MRKLFFLEKPKFFEASQSFALQGGKEKFAKTFLGKRFAKKVAKKAHNKTREGFATIEKELGIFSLGAATDLKKAIFVFLGLFAVALALGAVLFLLGFDDTVKVVEIVKQVPPLFLAYVLIIGVTAEEIFFRGFLARKIGIFGSSALFGLSHVFYGSIAEVLGAFLLGALLAWFFKRNKTLLPNIYAHIAYNLVVLSFIM